MTEHRPKQHRITLVLNNDRTEMTLKNGYFTSDDVPIDAVMASGLITKWNAKLISKRLRAALEPWLIDGNIYQHNNASILAAFNFGEAEPNFAWE